MCLLLGCTESLRFGLRSWWSMKESGSTSSWTTVFSNWSTRRTRMTKRRTRKNINPVFIIFVCFDSVCSFFFTKLWLFCSIVYKLIDSTDQNPNKYTIKSQSPFDSDGDSQQVFLIPSKTIKIISWSRWENLEHSNYQKLVVIKQNKNLTQKYIETPRRSKRRRSI